MRTASSRVLAHKLGLDRALHPARLRRRLLLPVARTPAAGQRRPVRLATRRRDWSACACAACSTQKLDAVIGYVLPLDAANATRAARSPAAVEDRPLVLPRRPHVPDPRRFADGLPPAARFAAVGQQGRLSVSASSTTRSRRAAPLRSAARVARAATAARTLGRRAGTRLARPARAARAGAACAADAERQQATASASAIRSQHRTPAAARRVGALDHAHGAVRRSARPAPRHRTDRPKRSVRQRLSACCMSSCRRSRELEDYLDLLAAVEADGGTSCGMKIVHGRLSAAARSAPEDAAGHARPGRDRGQHPSGARTGTNWSTTPSSSTTRRFETRLSAEKFMTDGRHTGTGGGNHFVLGGATPADSPFLRRPDLLASLLLYWHNHPSLSLPVLGPVHRPDEPGAARRRGAQRPGLRARDRAQARCAQQPLGLRRRSNMPAVARRPHAAQHPDRRDRQHAPQRVLHRQAVFARFQHRPPRPARTARLRNAAACAHEHRAAAAAARAGRALLGRSPTRRALTRWGTELHDRFLLPHLREDGLRRRASAKCGRPASPSTPTGSRRTSSSASRWSAQVQAMRHRADAAQRAGTMARDGRGRLGGRHGALCRFVAGTHRGARHRPERQPPCRHRQRQGAAAAAHRHASASSSPACATRRGTPPSALHPSIGAHAPLTFDLVDTWMKRSLGGCQYHRRAPGRAQLRDLPGQRLRGREPAPLALLRAWATRPAC